MQKRQLKKYAALTTASVMTLQLAACSSSNSLSSFEDDVIVEVSEEIVEDAVEEVTGTEIDDDYLSSVYDSEYAGACDDWREGEDGSFECIDEDSDLYAEHFFDGVMFASLGALAASALYKANNSKNGTDKKKVKYLTIPTSTPKTNSATSTPANSTNTNKSTVNSNVNNSSGTNNTTTTSKEKTPTVNSSPGTSSPVNNGATTNNATTTNKNTNSTVNSSSSNTNSSNKSSYSSGRSGFSSGGASRGGSASS